MSQQHTTTTPVAVEASTVGALAGFESRCTCGSVLRASLLSALEADRCRHLRWHEKAGR